MIDKAEIKHRFRRSIESYEENASVQRKIADYLFGLLARFLDYPPQRVLEIGCGTGLFTRRLRERIQPSVLYVNDLVEEVCLRTAERCGIPFTHCLAGDIEERELPGSFDLIVSSSTFQWFASPSETLGKLASHLSPGGLLAFSTFGPRNMAELRPFACNGLQYHSKRELTACLASRFEILCFEEQCEQLYFAEAVDVLRHLKKTGVNATGSSVFWTKATLQQFACRYEKDGSGERFPLTYHPMYFVCRRKV